MIAAVTNDLRSRLKVCIVSTFYSEPQHLSTARRFLHERDVSDLLLHTDLQRWGEVERSGVGMGEYGEEEEGGRIFWELELT